MAIFNEILVGRFAKQLQRIFSIKGEAPTKQLAGDIQPVFPIFSGAEYRFTEGWAQYFQVVGVVGVAAQFSSVQLRNPLGSNVVAIISRAFASGGSADFVQLTTQKPPTAPTTDLTTLTAPAPVDARNKGTSSSVLSSATLVSSAGLNSVLAVAVVPVNYYVDLINNPANEIVLLPGSVLKLNVTTANTTTQFGLWWRERTLEESEFNL